MTYCYTAANLRGSNVLFRGYKDGKLFFRKEKWEPTVYVPTNRDAGWHDLSGRKLEPKKFQDVQSYRNWIDQNSGISNFEYFGFENHKTAFLSAEFPGEITYDPEEIIVAFIDIETDSADGFPNVALADKEITAITVKVGGSYVVFGVGDYTPHRPDVEYRRSSDERTMLRDFLKFWEEIVPDVVSGWNSEGFDVPYIIHRLQRLFGEDEARRLSPWRILKSREVHVSATETTIVWEIFGIEHIDYLLLYKKFSGKMQESYRLDYIAHVEKLGFRKIDYSEYGSLHRLYRDDHQKFIEYNVRDVEIIDKLEEKTKLIRMAINIAYSSKVTFGDVFMTTRVWDGICYNYLNERRIAVPTKRQSQKSSQFAGAYVKEPKPGVYGWMMTFDVASEYPSLFMHYNTSPETFVEVLPVDTDRLLSGGGHDHLPHLLEKNLSMAANGACFRRDVRGFMPTLVDKFFEERQTYRKQAFAAKKLLEEVEEEIRRRGI